MRGRMGRPRLRRRININPKVKYFKPLGIPMSILEVVELNKEEVEALRLKNIKKLDQRECAQEMHTSPATFQRILSSAYHKISLALSEGQAIRILED
jgi:predicted DNA-binding protein (UPF0251 family)